MECENKTLYQDYSELYYDIANDRNFENEIKSLGLDKLSKEALVVELFAGPAYHSTILKKLRPDLNIVAVDNSQSMKETAINHGFNGKYIVDDINNALEQLDNIYKIIIPRYSIALVTEDVVLKLFHLAYEKLLSNGSLVIEIHPDSMTDHDMYIAGSWNNLDIYERKIETREGLAICRWPASTQVISEKPFIVKMGIEIIILNEDNKEEKLFFESHEYMHTRNRLDEIANSTGFSLSLSKTKEKKDSTFLHFIPISSKKNLNCFDSVFDISSNKLCNNMVKKSGLETSVHDSPLTTHVYNLL